MDLYWQRVVKAGALFQLLMVFTMWIFYILYGIELRGNLISQDFEVKVDGWENLRVSFWRDVHMRQGIKFLPAAPAQVNKWWELFFSFFFLLLLWGYKVPKTTYKPLSTNVSLMNVACNWIMSWLTILLTLKSFGVATNLINCQIMIFFKFLKHCQTINSSSNFCKK